MNIHEKLKQLADFHGIEYADALAAFNRVRNDGATEEQAILAIRCGFAMQSGKHEYFSAADLANILGISESEAQKMLESSPDAMTVTYPDWMK